MNIFKKSQELCHLLQNDKIKRDILYDSLERIEDLLDESHLHYSVEKCKTCGQLFFFEFLEFVDWANGDDPQYLTWVPIKTMEEGRKIAKKYDNAMYGIMGYVSDMQLRVNDSPTMDCDPEYAFLVSANK